MIDQKMVATLRAQPGMVAKWPSLVLVESEFEFCVLCHLFLKKLTNVFYNVSLQVVCHFTMNYKFTFNTKHYTWFIGENNQSTQ